MVKKLADSFDAFLASQAMGNDWGGSSHSSKCFWTGFVCGYLFFDQTQLSVQTLVGVGAGPRTLPVQRRLSGADPSDPPSLGPRPQQGALGPLGGFSWGPDPGNAPAPVLRGWRW